MAHTFVIGDIHGCSRLLAQLLTKIERVAFPQDTIVFLGDYIDRGPDTKGVITQILNLKAKSKYRLICLQGNHEDIFVRAHRNRSSLKWLTQYEGLATVASYAPDVADQLNRDLKDNPQNILGLLQKFYDTIPQSHLSFLKSELVSYYETDQLICVHAGLKPNIPLQDQRKDILLNSHPKDIIDNWQGPKTLVVGHKKTTEIADCPAGSALITDNMVCLDTGSAVTGFLTAIRFPDRMIIQTKSIRDK